MHKCWTCGAEHDLDAACPQSSDARSRQAAGEASPLFSEPSKPQAFPASFESECTCGDWIEVGDLIRADGDGGWIHEECDE